MENWRNPTVSQRSRKKTGGPIARYGNAESVFVWQMGGIPSLSRRMKPNDVGK